MRVFALKENLLELNVDYLIDLSESWLPLVLQYAGQLGLALITLALAGG